MDPIYNEAETISFSILLNACCRELPNFSFYQGIPKYDAPIAHFIRETGQDLHLVFDFSDDHSEVFVPVLYRSAGPVGHVFQFPAFERNTRTQTVQYIHQFRFLDLMIAYYGRQDSGINGGNMRTRLQNSLDNLVVFLKHFKARRRPINAAYLTYLQAEQSLVAGHTLHPLTKSREGFSAADLQLYSPETGGRFQLHYFLAHPDTVVEKSVTQQPFSHVLWENLNGYVPADSSMAHVLAEKHKAGWKPVIVHPWEAQYLLTTAEVKEMITQGVLVDIGTWGPAFTATSSVRTVYHEDSPWMIKCSLHVKLTSAKRVNYLRELERGYHFSRLFHQVVAQGMQDKHPDVVFLYDPGFISVHFQGKTMDGFNTCFRVNPFTGDQAATNIGLLASVCQEESLGQPARMVSIIESASAALQCTPAEAATLWFGKYLDILLPATVTMFDTYGFICELHQQNTLVEFDEHYLPTRLYFRDNQSYLFRKKMKDFIGAQLPELIGQDEPFQYDICLLDLLSHFMIISNLAALINVFGKYDIVPERTLLEVLYEKVHALHQATHSPVTNYLLHHRHWCIKGHLVTALRDVDSGQRPVAVTFKQCLNMLHSRYDATKVLAPSPPGEVFRRYFPTQDITISFRPVVVDTDLEMLHNWFHRPHTLAIWQMNWPIAQLERYYRQNLAGRMQSYIGLVNGEPTFNFEVYRATTDPVGDYYDVQPDDYGTHFMIATTDKQKKYPSQCMQAMLDWLFAQPEVGRLIGEGSVDSMAALMNKIHVGFRLEKVIDMPHKKANLNMCYREWYWEKFPENQFFVQSQILETDPTLLS